jgi:hypothetical protein
MNFIALGFALTDALHNPWLHGAALVVLLLCLPRLLNSYVAAFTSRSGSVRGSRTVSEETGDARRR